MMVVAYHAAGLLTLNSTPEPDFLKWGSSGVDIFFVISGFVMAISTHGKDNGPKFAWNFLKRRLIRIVPLYWILTTVVLLKDIEVRRHASLGHGPHAEISLGWIACSYLFIPYMNSLGKIVPLLSAGWTLNFEMLFYMLFAACLALRVGVVRWLGILLPAICLVGLFRTPSWPAVTTLMSPLLLEFYSGLLLGWLVMKGLQIKPIFSVVAGMCGLLLLVFEPAPDMHWRALAWGAPAFLTVAAIAMLEKHWHRSFPRWLLLIGKSSYSLYLLHTILFFFCYKVFLKLPSLTQRHSEAINTYNAALITLAITVPMSVRFFLWVEEPLTLFLRNRILSAGRPKPRELANDQADSHEPHVTAAWIHALSAGE